jgi:hypothetical protein
MLTKTLLETHAVISSPKPPQLAEIRSKLQATSISQQEQQQLVEQAKQVSEHLERVAKPLYRRDKGIGRDSVAYASYAFGPSNADLAAKALPYAEELRSALERDDFEAALAAENAIQNLFPNEH